MLGGILAREGWHLTACAWISVLVTAFIDYLTGYEIGFFVFYFIPVGLAAWAGGRRVGLLLACTCAVVWLVVDMTTAHPYSSEWYRYENVLIRYAAFVIVALLVAEMKTLLEKERELLSRLTHALQEVRELRGLLPMCANCKKIRNDQGDWEVLESYISARSKAEFTHSLCPACEQRLYPDFSKPGVHERTG
jgi:hypothetical protein